MIKNLQERLQHATDSRIWQGFWTCFALFAMLNLALAFDFHGWVRLAADVCLIPMLGVLLCEQIRRKQ
jgi:hypothetical protein